MNWKKILRKLMTLKTAKESKKNEPTAGPSDEAVHIFEFGDASKLTLGQGGAVSEQHQHRNQ